VWGVRFARWIHRKNEFALFPFVAKTESGFASRFAHLVGLHDIPQPRRFEVLPYTVARGTYHDPWVAANPFDGTSRYFGGAGLDLKYGITSNLTLDATVNPDFGQVEIDPAFVNLTVFEQFLPEHRPFFVEGVDIFQFGGNGGGIHGFYWSPRFFYSRRIGRPPRGDATSPGQFVQMPEHTAILGAAKLSGKTAGWSLGVLDALTGREYARVADTVAGTRYADEVEPLTNHFVGRLKRDYDGGNTSVGLLGMAVNRDLRTPALGFLPRASYAGGVDLFHRWGRSTYTLAANLGFASVRGDTLALQRAQRASTRYYQRPDARSFQYDPSRTSLEGLTGELYVNKVAERPRLSDTDRPHLGRRDHRLPLDHAGQGGSGGECLRRCSANLELRRRQSPEPHRSLQFWDIPELLVLRRRWVVRGACDRRPTHPRWTAGCVAGHVGPGRHGRDRQSPDGERHDLHRVFAE
jgi:hypothetical protein